jgi:hypothetical protein
VGCCKYSDESSGSGTTKLATWPVVVTVVPCDWVSFSAVAVGLVSTSMSHRNLYPSGCSKWNGMSSSWMGQILSETRHVSL